MKKCLLVMLCLLLLCVGALAEEADYEYRTLPDGTVEITKYTGSGTDITVPDTLGGGQVTAIGEGAFMNNTALKIVMMPDSLRTIGDFAFYGCTNLGYCDISGNYMESIGHSAFYECKSLVGISTPHSMTTLGDRAFYGCTKLEEVFASSALQTIGSEAFYGCTAIKKVDLRGVTHLGSSAFEECTALETVKLPDSLTHVGDMAFAACRKLKTVNLPDGLQSLGQGAFMACNDVTVSVRPGTSAYKLAETAGLNLKADFSEELKVKPGEVSITPPQQGSDAFASMMGIIDTVKEQVPAATQAPSEPERLPYTCIMTADETLKLTRFWQHIDTSSHVVIPAAIDGIPVTRLGRNLFADMRGITRVTLPEGIIQIEEKAFQNCADLVQVDLPQSLKIIGDGIFEGCPKLTYVTLPDNIRQIGQNIFGGQNTTVAVKEGTAAWQRMVEEGMNVVEPGSASMAPAPVAPAPTQVPTPVPTQVPTPVPTQVPAPAALPGAADYQCMPAGDGTLRLMRYTGQGGKVVVPAQIDGQAVSYIHAAFTNRSDITEVVIPEGVNALGPSVFKNCTGLTKVTLPQSLNEIGQEAFSGCTALKSLSLPDEIYLLGRDVFAGCTNLAVNLNPGTRTYTTLQREGLVQ